MNEDYKKNEELEATQAENNEEKAEAIEQNNTSQKEADEVKSEASANSPKETESSENEEKRETTSDKESENEKSATNEASDLEKTAEAPTENAPKESAVSSENAQSVSAKKMKKPLLISLIAGGVAFLTALTLFLVLFIPIWFGNHFANSFAELLPDTRALEELYSELQDSGYNETLTINLPKGNLTQRSGFLISYVGYFVGDLRDGKGREHLSLDTERGKIALDISYDEDKITVGGLAGEGVYVTLPRKNFEKALESSVFAPDSGSAYALDEDSYESLIDALSGENAYDVYTDFFEDVLSEWEDIMEKETRTSFAKGAFKLEREVTYKMSYGDICDMIDAFFDVLEDYDELEGALGNDEIAAMKSALKQAYFGMSLEYTYRVVGNRLDMARLTFIIEETGTLSVTLSPIKEEGKVGAMISLKTNASGTHNDTETILKYTTRENEESIESALILTDDDPTTPYTNIYNFKYDKAAHTYEATVTVDGGNFFRTAGMFEIYDGSEGFKFTVDTFAVAGNNYGTLSYEVKRDPTASGVKVESGTNILTASEKDIQVLLSKLDVDSISTVIYDISGKVLPGYSVYKPETLEEETKNATYSFQKYKSKYGGTSHSRAYYYSDTFNLYILMDIENGAIVCTYKESVSSLDTQRYYALQSDPKFEQHSFKFSSHKDATCTAPGYDRYYCHICGAWSDESYAYTGHEMTVVTVSDYLYDDGNTYNVKLSYCTKCLLPDYIAIGARMVIDFDEEEGKCYITKCLNMDYFAIPDKILEYTSNFGIKLSYLVSLTSVRIPKNIETLTKGAFAKENGIKVLVIPNTLTRIETGAFRDNMIPEVIFFEGSEEEWNSIAFGGYLEKWADVEVIFRPDGVTAEDISEALGDAE